MIDKALIDVVERSARAALPEGVSLARGIALPRGADPFVGGEQPFVLVSSRWARIASGGVLLGGSFAAMTHLFGLDTAAARVEADPSKRADWEEELRVATLVLTRAVGVAVLELGELPPELMPTTVARCASEAATRDAVGQVTDAVAFVVHAGALSLRMVVAIPSVLTARLSRDPFEAQAPPERALDGPQPVAAMPDSLRAAHDPLAWVPIDLTVELGCARVQLSAVMRAGEGELVALDRAFDDPVAHVSEVATIALGELQVNDRNRLELCITAVSRPAAPTLLPDHDLSLASGPDQHDPQEQTDD